MPKQQRTRDLEIAAAFGKRLRAVRKDKGMTQEALAEAADLHSTFISNVERGYRVPSLPTVLRLSVALDLPPGDLVDGLTV